MPLPMPLEPPTTRTCLPLKSSSFIAPSILYPTWFDLSAYRCQPCQSCSARHHLPRALDVRFQITEHDAEPVPAGGVVPDRRDHPGGRRLDGAECLSRSPDAAQRAAVAAWCAADPGPIFLWSRLGPGSAVHRRRDAAPRPGHELRNACMRRMRPEDVDIARSGSSFSRKWSGTTARLDQEKRHDCLDPAASPAFFR
jgi:hypothetical protein